MTNEPTILNTIIFRGRRIHACEEGVFDEVDGVLVERKLDFSNLSGDYKEEVPRVVLSGRDAKPQTIESRSCVRLYD